MTKITIEDCIEKIPNQFDLVLLSARRSRDIGAGAQIQVDRKHDRNPVVALREIGKGMVNPGQLEERLVNSLRARQPVVQTENESQEVKDALSELAGEDFAGIADTDQAILGGVQDMEIIEQP
ncbi:MAG: DNA-directed RNA polymerase subunit omega [Alphaproteobacteria bacterium]|nr:DNA-directed RNA polymerase subunit omega [Alphaproteobacteria bacterium]